MQVSFKVKVGRKLEENLRTQAGVHVIESVCLIWGLLDTGFTVLIKVQNLLK